MSFPTDVAGFTQDEIEALNLRANRPVRGLVVGCLTLLHDLVARYTGSMFLVQFPQEEVALELLNRRLESLGSEERYMARVAPYVDAYRRVRRMFEEDGSTPGLQAQAQSVADELVDAWSAITQHPYRAEESHATASRPEPRRAAG